MKLLNTPLQIGNLEIKNRLVMPPMASAKATDAGRVTLQLCDYYREKSSGGYIGLIITEHSYISAEGKAGENQVSIAYDGDIEGLKQLAATIHECGSKAIIQISHAGGAAKREITGKDAFAPSAVKMPKTGLVPLEMKRTDIEKVIADFAAAAVRAKKAGFDGVEIHSAHGYLLNQFYSPLTNRRTDEYGVQTVESRLRLHVEILRAIRELVGDKYPIAVRLGACDDVEGGTTLDDSVAAAVLLERTGVDLLDISGGFCGYIRPNVKGQGYFGDLSEAIKKAVRIPVLLTGGVTDAVAAEMLLESGKADLIGVGRAILADSLWAQKAMASLRHA